MLTWLKINQWICLNFVKQMCLNIVMEWYGSRNEEWETCNRLSVRDEFQWKSLKMFVLYCTWMFGSPVLAADRMPLFEKAYAFAVYVRCDGCLGLVKIFVCVDWWCRYCFNWLVLNAVGIRHILKDLEILERKKWQHLIQVHRPSNAVSRELL